MSRVLIKRVGKFSIRIYNPPMENVIFTSSALSVRKLQISTGRVKLKDPWLLFREEQTKSPRAPADGRVEAAFPRSSQPPSLPLGTRNPQRSGAARGSQRHRRAGSCPGSSRQLTCNPLQPGSRQFLVLAKPGFLRSPNENSGFDFSI